MFLLQKWHQIITSLICPLCCIILVHFLLRRIQAGQYMSNFDATHNVGLSPDYFRVPSAGNFSLN